MMIVFAVEGSGFGDVMTSPNPELSKGIPKEPQPRHVVPVTMIVLMKF
jgi:hypothetical protein